MKVFLKCFLVIAIIFAISTVSGAILDKLHILPLSIIGFIAVLSFNWVAIDKLFKELGI